MPEEALGAEPAVDIEDAGLDGGTSTGASGDETTGGEPRRMIRRKGKRRGKGPSLRERNPYQG